LIPISKNSFGSDYEPMSWIRCVW